MFFGLVVLILSCNNSSSTNKVIDGCDSIIITFNAPNSDSIIKVVSSKESKAIKKLGGFLNGKETEQFKCGYDGNFIFYKNGKQLLPVIFKYTEQGCEHFLFDMGDNVKSVAMTSEAKNFFTSLMEGKDWY